MLNILSQEFYVFIGARSAHECFLLNIFYEPPQSLIFIVMKKELLTQADNYHLYLFYGNFLLSQDPLGFNKAQVHNVKTQIKRKIPGKGILQIIII